MLDLFTSKVCTASCDSLPANTKLTRTHKMDLGGGWVLWTRNELPPQNWTHGRIVLYSQHALRGDALGRMEDGSPTMQFDRPKIEQRAKDNWGSTRARYIVAGDAGWARQLDDQGEVEGLAYKVPSP